MGAAFTDVSHLLTESILSVSAFRQVTPMRSLYASCKPQ